MFRIPTIKNLAEIDENIGTAKIQRNNQSNHINKIKGISECYSIECKSNNIIYDSVKDEIYCSDCGHVLRQALHDYEDLFINNE